MSEGAESSQAADCLGAAAAHPSAVSVLPLLSSPLLSSHLHSADVVERAILMLLDGSIATRVVIVRIAVLFGTRLVRAQCGLIACHVCGGAIGLCVFK